MFFLCSRLRMTYFPLYDYRSDPLRILSVRRIKQECPAVPPEPDPPDPAPKAAAAHSQDGGEPPDPARSERDGGGAPSLGPEADPRPAIEGRRQQVWRGGSGEIPDCAYWPQRPAPPERDAPAPAAAEPESGEAERTRLMLAWLNKHWDLVEAMARADETPLRPPPTPSAPPEPPPRVHVRRGDRWNKPKMAEFLRQLAATHSVSAAARAVGMHRRSAYKLRSRLKGQPFDIAWETAFRHGYDNLAHAALELAIEGEEVRTIIKASSRARTASATRSSSCSCSRCATARVHRCSAAMARRPSTGATTGMSCCSGSRPARSTGAMSARRSGQTSLQRSAFRTPSARWR